VAGYIAEQKLLCLLGQVRALDWFIFTPMDPTRTVDLHSFLFD